MLTRTCSILIVLLAMLFSALSQTENFETVSGTKLSEPIPDSGPDVDDPDLVVETVSRDLKFPTSMAFLNEDDILVLEKNEGIIMRIKDGNILPEPILDVNVANQVERGMLGIAVSRNSDDSIFVFLYFTEAKTKDGDLPIGNRLYRYELIDGKLENPKILLDLPAIPGPIHNGGKITIGPDNNLYVIVGDLERPHLQENKFPNGIGGILRVTKDGEVVGDKGILGEEHPLDMYYAYGIRNSFGIDFDPVTGNLWDTENGAGFGDEMNLVRPGFNSGWNKVQGVWEYMGYSIQGKIVPYDSIVRDLPGLTDFDGNSEYSSPEFTWERSVGITAIKFLDTDSLGEEYEDDIFIGDFHNGNLYHFGLNEDRTELSLDAQLVDRVANKADELEQVIFGKRFGGITDIQVSPDGYLYVLSLYQGGGNCDEEKSDNDDCISYDSSLEGRIFRIIPTDQSDQFDEENNGDGS